MSLTHQITLEKQAYKRDSAYCYTNNVWERMVKGQAIIEADLKNIIIYQIQERKVGVHYNRDKHMT